MSEGRRNARTSALSFATVSSNTSVDANNMKAKMCHVIREDLSRRPQLIMKRRVSTQEINKMAFEKRENVDEKQVGNQKLNNEKKVFVKKKRLTNRS
jgi:hypothetical protein